MVHLNIFECEEQYGLLCENNYKEPKYEIICLSSMIFVNILVVQLWSSDLYSCWFCGLPLSCEATSGKNIEISRIHQLIVLNEQTKCPA